jgi:hypothetical protein
LAVQAANGKDNRKLTGNNENTVDGLQFYFNNKINLRICVTKNKDMEKGVIPKRHVMFITSDLMFLLFQPLGCNL